MKTIENFVDESIKYELDVYNLYTIFKETLIHDADFWKKIADEELNHAYILRKSKSLFEENAELLNMISIQDIKKVNECRNLFKHFIVDFKKNPTLKTACEIAISIENSLVENNYQKFMNSLQDNDLIKILQKLNGEEKDHIKRIQEYYNSKKV
jgi:rubrerythrin